MDRRAFGETVSPRGELASYAFGWVGGHEERVGRMTVGIGVGNPGGASFHADVWINADGERVMGLVDEPFEEVPQGGPHLSAEEARAHDTLPFIWWVADEALAQDRRAWWMEHWLRGTRSFATRPVVEGGEPVRHVVRDEDGDWQLLCGTVEADDPQVFHLHHALDRDQTLLEVLDLEPGQAADRERLGGRWERA